MDNCYQFAAIKGTQAHRAFYVAMLPYGSVAKVLGALAATNPKRGRAVNKARIPALAAYLQSASDGHCVPPVHVMVDGLMRFETADFSRSVGQLFLEMSAALSVIDGGHRIAAISEALVDRPSLARETLPVCFYAAAGEDAAQEMFQTINGKAVRPARGKRGPAASSLRTPS